MSNNTSGILIRTAEQLCHLIGNSSAAIKIGNHKTRFSGYSLVPLTKEHFYPYRLEVWISLTGGYYWSASKFIDIERGDEDQADIINMRNVEVQSLDQLVNFCWSNNPDIKQFNFVKLDKRLFNRYRHTINRYFRESYQHCFYNVPEMIEIGLDNPNISTWGLIDQDNNLLAINSSEIMEIESTLRLAWLRNTLARQNSGLTALTKYWTIQNLFEDCRDINEILTYSALGNTFRTNLRLGFDKTCHFMLNNDINNVLYLDACADINRGEVFRRVFTDSFGQRHTYINGTNMVFRRKESWDYLTDRLD